MHTDPRVSSSHPHPAPVRLLVCDGSALVRSTLARLLGGRADITLVDTARNLREAIEKTTMLHPDVAAIDVESPTFGGPQAVVEIARAGATPQTEGPAVLACGRETATGAHTGVRALAEGALGVVLLNAERLSKEPETCVEELASSAVRLRDDRRLDRRRPVMRIFAAFAWERPRAGVVVVGGGEGCVPELEGLLSRLPASLGFPIVIAPRLPARLTRALADRLDAAGAVSVIHAENGMPLHPGAAYVVPGDRIGRVRTLGLGAARLELLPGCGASRPVDELFASCARQRQLSGMGIMLSGTGEDGRAGGEALSATGGTLVALRPEEAACAGMPLGAIEAGGTSMSLEQLVELVRMIGMPLARAA